MEHRITGLLLSLLLAAAVFARADGGFLQGKEQWPGVMLLTGFDLKPNQTSFRVPELADPYATIVKDGAVISGTAQYYLKFRSVSDIARGGPYQIVWNDYYYADGTPMEGERFYAHSWDMKPVLWSLSAKEGLRLWDAARDSDAPTVVWYGGHMRPRAGKKTSRWPDDNYSRDVFAFVEKEPGKWISREQSIFSARADWPRATGNFLGHRYGHQITMVPKLDGEKKLRYIPAVFYEEVTQTREDGSPLVTKIFMDEMLSPFQAAGRPVELISPTYSSALREDGSTLVEGPLYFRFMFEREEWEAIGFSAGSFYAKYPASFAARRVAEGLQGKPYRVDLKDGGKDLNDAGEELREALNLSGGPARPAVIVAPNGNAILGEGGRLQVLFHGYRNDILPDRSKYRLDQTFRVAMLASLKVTKGPNDTLRFQLMPNQLRPRLAEQR